MTIQRTIAAVITFALATLLCAPAFAGFWGLAQASNSGCCCATQQTQPLAHVDAPQCQCDSCACTLEQAPAPAWPLTVESPTSQLALPLPTIAIPWSRPAATRPVQTVVSPRGPPNTAGPPLYLLLDSFLI